MMVPAFADLGASDPDASQSCFGTWRASDASGYNRGGGEGVALSERQGFNAEQNVIDKEACGFGI